MSNPTTGEPHQALILKENIEVAKTLQEWTPALLSRLFDSECSPEEAIKRICALHNAALAARDKQWERQTEALVEQLAAEREKTAEIILKNSQRDLMSKMKIADIEKMERQLAAERERSKELFEDLEHYSEVIDKRELEIQQLREQLAAEREKARVQMAAAQHNRLIAEETLAATVKAITLAKHRIINPTHTAGQSAYDVLDAALAKIGQA